MRFRCICGTYLKDKLTLCRQCAIKYGDSWPAWVGLCYNSLNCGGDYENDLEHVKAEPYGKKGADVKGVEEPKFWDRGARQCPICHNPISIKERLCKEHFIEFGKDPTKWPEWLQALVTNDEKNIEYASEHREGSTNDETFNGGRDINRAATKGDKTAGSLGGRTIAHFNQDEISTETVNWYDNELNSPGSTSPALGEIAGDKLGHKYNAIAWKGANDQYKGLEVFSERDQLDDKIAAEQKLNLRTPREKNVILFYLNGHTQDEIAELMNMRQQMVSEILRKSGIKRH